MVNYVRPGKGFVPNFPLFQKVQVNGEKAIPLYNWLKSKVSCTPTESDTWVINESPKALQVIPCKEGDVRWNFEKFLVDRTGIQVKRYHPKKLPLEISEDIEAFLDN